MRFALLIFSVIIAGGLVIYLRSQQGWKIWEIKTTQEEKAQILMGTLTLKSPAFEDQGFIPKKYTCQGENINPPLETGGIPEGTESLVLIMDDPDAPLGTWVHWMIWNIPPTTREIAENSVPEGVEGTTSFGKPGYGGPCPPMGTHRYFFKLYALNRILNLPSSAKKDDLERAMKDYILDKTELIGLYKAG